jgi:Skp family chaperone for outer membrane proteins
MEQRDEQSAKKLSIAAILGTLKSCAELLPENAMPVVDSQRALVEKLKGALEKFKDEDKPEEQEVLEQINNMVRGYQAFLANKQRNTEDLKLVLDPGTKAISLITKKLRKEGQQISGDKQLAAILSVVGCAIAKFLTGIMMLVTKAGASLFSKTGSASATRVVAEVWAKAYEKECERFNANLNEAKGKGMALTPESLELQTALADLNKSLNSSKAKQMFFKPEAKEGPDGGAAAAAAAASGSRR